MRVRKIGLLRGSLAILLLLALSVSGSVIASAQSKKAPSKAAGTSTPTAADAGVSFVPQSVPAGAAVTNAQTQAIAVATDSVGAMATAQGVQVSVAYGSFTDSQYTGPLPSGQQAPLYVGRPVWLVTFSGVELPSTVPGSSSNNHEINVAVDAVSGQYLEAYSYR